MIKTSRVRLCFLCLPILIVGALILACGRDTRPQYVILILMDAVRPDHVGCYGYNRDTTPRIDELARSGVVFEQAVAEAPWTLPSVATILTSTFPCQHGARRIEGKNVAMKAGEVTFVELLAAEGYRTCAMSTARIFIPELGLSRGFKESYVVGPGQDVLEKVAAMELSDTAIEWLRRNKNEKCFLFIHHYDTHYPYKAERGCTDRFNPGYEGPYRFRFGDSSLRILKAARVGRLADAVTLTEADLAQIKTLYDCELVRTDRAIGRLVDSLSAWGSLEKSVIIISADHGEEFLERGSLDHGQTVFDESIRVPLVIHCPTLAGGPTRVRQQVGLIDLAPTILDILGLSKPASFEGVSLLPLMTGSGDLAEQQLRPSGLPTACLVSEAIAHRPEKKALRCPPWKLVFDPFFGMDQLYNLADDPGETINLIDSEPEMAANLSDILLTSMEAYYPGGWCIAWRAGSGRAIEGRVNVGSGLIEVIGHNLTPEVSRYDSLATSADRREVYFRSRSDDRWEGIEIRMPSRQKAMIDLTLAGEHDLEVLIGGKVRRITFPEELTPGETEISRNNLRRLFRQDDAELVVFWIDPGSEPTAQDEKQEELRRKLKTIGYID